MMHVIDFLRTHALSLSTLTKFAFVLAILIGVPYLSRWARLPVAVGLLLSGVLVGPYGLDLIGQPRPIAAFFAGTGKLFLMFFMDHLYAATTGHPGRVAIWLSCGPSHRARFTSGL